MNYKKYNQNAWDQKAFQKDIWTQPVSSEVVDQGRKGQLEIVLTPTKNIPRHWFPKELKNLKVLCLASGGGQQGPVLAAAGAEVTVLDYSQQQLEQDILVANREGLDIKTVQGDMMDLSMFEDESFELIVHPWSNCFVEDVEKVWSESARVLKYGGLLLSGFGNPLDYIFDLKEMEKGNLLVRHSIPYSDLKDLSEDELSEMLYDKGEPLTFGHSLEDQIGGQLRAGFVITDFYEDSSGGDGPLDKFINIGMATRAVKFKIDLGL